MKQCKNLSARLALCVVAACASAGMAQDAAVAAGGLSPTALYLRAGTVDTAKPAGALAAVIGGRPVGTRFVVQLDGPVTPERRARMTGAGLKVGDYLPSYAYIVHVDRVDAAALNGLEFVRWAGEYQSAWKLDPELLKRPYATPERQALLAQGRYSVTVALFAGVNQGAAEKAIWAVPGAVISGSSAVMDHLELMVELPLGQVNALAGVAEVQFVEPTPEVTIRNSTTRWIIQSNQTNVTPVYDAGIHGEGQIVGVLDNGFDINHCSFKDNINNTPGPSHRKVVYRTDGVGSHGTHCSGTAAGDAGNTGDTRGIAYGAKLAYSNWPDFTEMGMINALTPHYGAGARVHTNSWGDDGTTAYNSLCRGIDSFQYSHEESQIMFAVTNLSALKNPENAKNLVAVGNSGDTPAQGTFCTGGAGPTSDGRRKPEIWAPGCDTTSAASNTACSTTQMTGTSMASPAVTGAAALVRQYYTEGYHATGIANPSAAFTPSGALIKATMLNSGQDMDAAGYPGVREGWGRLLLDRSMFFEGEPRKLRVTDVRNAQGLATNGFADIQFGVQSSVEPLRVTVVWTEPPAAAGASFAPVNDLDVEVIAPNGTTYKGNVFAGGVSVAGGNKDDRNNVEQVHVTNPIPGPWTLRVRGANVAVGAQGYATVVSGNVGDPIPQPLYAVLATPLPSLLAPNTAMTLDVQVTPGTQTYQSGSAFYRHGSSGVYSQVALAPQGGNLYRATIPGGPCGQDPEVYFNVTGSGGAALSLPANAPTGFFTTTVGELTPGTLLSETFVAGLPAGWQMDGLWNVGSNCPPSGQCSGTTWAHYGNAACNFNTGTANSGSLSMPPMTVHSLPNAPLVLSYCSAKASEAEPQWDIATVKVNGQVVDTAPISASWQTRTVNLNAFSGQTVTISFSFDTVDSVENDFAGWRVDNIQLTGATIGCSTPPCYANCDGSTSAPVLNVADFTCFLQRFAAGESYANCDGSTSAPTLNVADFTCFLQSFAAGCR